MTKTESCLVITKCYFSDHWYVIRKTWGMGEEKLFTGSSFAEAKKYLEEHKNES